MLSNLPHHQATVSNIAGRLLAPFHRMAGPEGFRELRSLKTRQHNYQTRKQELVSCIIAVGIKRSKYTFAFATLVLKYLQSTIIHNRVRTGLSRTTK